MYSILVYEKRQWQWYSSSGDGGPHFSLCLAISNRWCGDWNQTCEALEEIAKHFVLSPPEAQSRLLVVKVFPIKAQTKLTLTFDTP